MILEKGLTIGGKPLKDHLEAIGHQDALGYVRMLAAETRPIRKTDIRELHRLVLQRVAPADTGRYSAHQRAIAGSPLLLPSPAEIPALMGDFTRWLATAPWDADTTFAAHARLSTIHPFSDGNGRTARLLMNLLLLRAGFPPLVIALEHLARYIDALQAIQLQGDPAPYEALMAERLRRASTITSNSSPAPGIKPGERPAAAAVDRRRKAGRRIRFCFSSSLHSFRPRSQRRKQAGTHRGHRCRLSRLSDNPVRGLQIAGSVVPPQAGTQGFNCLAWASCSPGDDLVSARFARGFLRATSGQATAWRRCGAIGAPHGRSHDTP
jgi:hypothetical protein